MRRRKAPTLALDTIVLVARSISGGRVNVVGLRLPEDEERQAAPLTRLARFKRKLSETLVVRWRGSRTGAARRVSREAHYLISPASLGSVRLISGMQMISSSPVNSASM